MKTTWQCHYTQRHSSTFESGWVFAPDFLRFTKALIALDIFFIELWLSWKDWGHLERFGWWFLWLWWLSVMFNHPSITYFYPNPSLGKALKASILRKVLIFIQAVLRHLAKKSQVLSKPGLGDLILVNHIHIPGTWFGTVLWSIWGTSDSFLLPIVVIVMAKSSATANSRDFVPCDSDVWRLTRLTAKQHQSRTAQK